MFAASSSGLERRSILLRLDVVEILSVEAMTLWSFLPENQYSYYLLYLNVSYLYNTETYLKSLANYDLLFVDEEENSNLENQETLPKLIYTCPKDDLYGIYLKEGEQLYLK